MASRGNNGAPRSGPARGGGGGGSIYEGFRKDVLNARLFLFVACLWPLWVLALFGASSASNTTTASTALGPSSVVQSPTQHRLNLRHMMDRVDIMGYGPTHPRIAFVVIGDEVEDTKATVESIYRYTDLNRVFLITVTMDGMDEDPSLVSALNQMNQGSVPHWHGFRPDLHFIDTDKKIQHTNDQEHGRKLHTIFHPEKIGLTAARIEAVEFVRLLEDKHLKAGLKSPEEDLIVVFLQSGLQLTDQSWLPAVTNALIVPPPIIKGDEDVALKLANAVSFRLEDSGKVTSFDEKFAPVIQANAKTSEINLSNGQSYGTPMFNGGGIAMRLETFVYLPAQDESLKDPWPANLDLALNLWLCADGIDILHDAQVTSTNSWMESLPIVPLDPQVAARFAAVWMDDLMQQKFFQAYSTTITRLDWETKVRQAKHSPTFPKGNLAKRCRPFEWYATEVNSDLSKIIEQSGYGKASVTTNGSGGGVVKKEEMAEVAAAIENHDARHPGVENPNIRANQELANDKKLSHEEDTIDQVHAEPPPLIAERPKPKVPLRPTNLEIVQKATAVDISYLAVHGGHKDHPHMGAKDEEGNWGYVHDEKALSRNPPPFSWPDGYEQEACSLRDNNFRMLTERVVVDLEYDKKMTDSGVKRDKIFCLIYTIESGHPKIPFIRETWGPKCDGFMVGSTKTDKSLGAVEIPHEGEEDYDNIWQKVRSMWSYIYDNYYEAYDWFHIGGDDLFLIVENMRLYLESEEIRTAANGGTYLPFGNETQQTPLLLGRRFKYMGHMDEIFDSGGSGYTMNKAALKLLVTEGFPNYFPHAHTFSEDTMVAKILRKFGVVPYDTKDEDGGERYMPFMPGHHWGYHLPKNPKDDWYAMYSIDIKEGPDHCSPKSLAFHYVKDKAMKRLFALAYGLCSDKYMQI